MVNPRENDVGCSPASKCSMRYEYIAMITIVGFGVATMCRRLVVAKATIKRNVQGVAFAAL